MLLSVFAPPYRTQQFPTAAAEPMAAVLHGCQPTVRKIPPPSCSVGPAPAPNSISKQQMARAGAQRRAMDCQAMVRTYGTKELRKSSHMNSISSKEYGLEVWISGMDRLARVCIRTSHLVANNSPSRLPLVSIHFPAQNQIHNILCT